MAFLQCRLGEGGSRISGFLTVQGARGNSKLYGFLTVQGGGRGGSSNFLFLQCREVGGGSSRLYGFPRLTGYRVFNMTQ